MNLCIPVEEDLGLKSLVCAHFGSAPLFMIVDTDSQSCRVIENRSTHDGHGTCMPLQSLAGEKLDGMVVGGIGMGALNKLMAAGIQVFMAQHATVEETLAAWKGGHLQTVQPGQACAQHGHGH